MRDFFTSLTVLILGILLIIGAVDVATQFAGRPVSAPCNCGK